MLEGLRQEIQQLISLYEGEKRRADELSGRLSKAEVEIERYTRQITELNRQVDNLKLKSALTSESGNIRARECIDRLIRDIDRCITFMEG